MYGLEKRIIYAFTRRSFWLCFPSCEAKREINTNITMEWAQFVTRVHTSFYFLQGITNPYRDKNGDLHVSTPCLARSIPVLLRTSHSFLMTSQMHYATQQLWRAHSKKTIANSTLFTAIFTANIIRNPHNLGDVIINPYLYFTSDLTKPSLKIGYGWFINSIETEERNTYSCQRLRKLVFIKVAPGINMVYVLTILRQYKHSDPV